VQNDTDDITSSKIAGCDVALVPPKDGKPSGALRPFLTGFIGSEDAVNIHPRGIAIAKDGSVLVMTTRAARSGACQGDRLPLGRLRLFKAVLL
jgi:glucose/arabinose dehydrogenase